MTTLALHIVRPLPPSLVNRDRNGQTKTIRVGGRPRVRVSSQAIKRAMRLYFADFELLSPENLGTRTRGLPRLLATEFQTRGYTTDEAMQLSLHTFWGMGILDRDPKNAAKKQTNVAMFVGNSEVAAIADTVEDMLGKDSDLRSQLWPSERVLPGADESEPAAKKDLKAECPEAWKRAGVAARRALDPKSAVDIALFGRFMAEDRNIDVTAAAAVAHAVSVDEMEVTQDFFTAVDDLARAQEEQSSGFAYGDTTPLTAPVMYEHTSLSLKTLGANLDGNDKLVEAAVRAWATAAIHSVPKAKVSGTAHTTLPALVVGMSLSQQPTSLFKAFIRPVERTASDDVLTVAARKLARQFAADTAAYGNPATHVWHTHALPDIDDDVLTESGFGARLPASGLIDRLVAQALIDPVRA